LRSAFLFNLQTYCINRQVPDSACTATAIFTGVKTNYEVTNLSGNVARGNCRGQMDSRNHLDSIFKYAQDAGKATGIVTNTRVTHATPASTYANVGHRYWEGNDGTPTGCEDIAQQLITGQVGSRFDVILGGGSRYFRPNTFLDRNRMRGRRTDGKNLIDDYLRLNARRRAVFVETRVIFQ
jgi:alkaline phosphatase